MTFSLRHPRSSALEAISPELALVDPALGRDARRRLPDLPGFLPRRSRSWYELPSVRLAAVACVVALTLTAAVRPTRSEQAAPTVASPQVIGSGGQTFAWVTSPGAAAYEFQLFRGSERVFRARVAEPRVHVDERYVARSGSYRWYVWPVAGGDAVPAGEASVSATLTIVRGRG